VTGVLQTAVAKRVQGQRSSPLQAIGAALVAGAAVAALTYRLVRS
jgi:hypothetical protein